MRIFVVAATACLVVAACTDGPAERMSPSPTEAAAYAGGVSPGAQPDGQRETLQMVPTDFSPRVVSVSDDGLRVEVRWWDGGCLAFDRIEVTESARTVQITAVLKSPLTSVGPSPGAWPEAHTCNPMLHSGRETVELVDPVGDRHIETSATVEPTPGGDLLIVTPSPDG